MSVTRSVTKTIKRASLLAAGALGVVFLFGGGLAKAGLLIGFLLFVAFAFVLTMWRPGLKLALRHPLIADASVTLLTLLFLGAKGITAIVAATAAGVFFSLFIHNDWLWRVLGVIEDSESKMTLAREFSPVPALA